MNLITVIIIGVMISSAQGGLLDKFCISPKCNEEQEQYPDDIINDKMNKFLEGQDLKKDAFQMYMKAAKNVLEELKNHNSGEATLIKMLEAFVAIEPISSRLSEYSPECTEKNTENLTRMQKLLMNNSGNSRSNGLTNKRPFNLVINSSGAIYFFDCLNKIKHNSMKQAKALEKKDPDTNAVNRLNSMSKFNFEPSSFFKDPFETIDKRAIQIVKENQFWLTFLQLIDVRLLNQYFSLAKIGTDFLFLGCKLVDANQDLKKTFEDGIKLLDAAVSAKWESARHHSHPWVDYAICRAAQKEFNERGDSLVSMIKNERPETKTKSIGEIDGRNQFFWTPMIGHE